MWDWFINLLTQILATLAGWTGDWGLAIIVITIIMRIIVMPLMTKSTASSARMQALQPKMREIQERYADDPVRQSEEMRKFYSENKFNPLGGCLPILIQMPVFFALFAVIKEIPKDASFFNILPTLSQSAAGSFAAGGFAEAWIYIILVLLFGVLTAVPMLMNLKNTPEEQRQTTITMGVVMAVMMLWFGWTVPGGVLLYYDASAIWQTVQMKIVTQRVMEKVKAETEAKLANQGREIDVVLKERKPRPKKKSN